MFVVPGDGYGEGVLRYQSAGMTEKSAGLKTISSFGLSRYFVVQNTVHDLHYSTDLPFKRPGDHF